MSICANLENCAKYTAAREIKKYGFRGCAKRHNVSDTTIKRWLKTLRENEKINEENFKFIKEFQLSKYVDLYYGHEYPIIF